MRIFQGAKIIIRKIKETNTYQKYAEFKEQMKDQKMNRELIGVDRIGNKYYQYYSPYGLPQRREVEFIDKTSYALNDQAFWMWLNKRQEHSPTKEEVERYYFEEAMRVQRGIEWDQKEQMLIEQYYAQRKVVLEQQKKQHLQLSSQHLTEVEKDEQQKIVEKLALEEEFNQNPVTQIRDNDKPEEEYKPQKWSPKSKQRRPPTQSQE